MLQRSNFMYLNCDMKKEGPAGATFEEEHVELTPVA